MSFAPAQLEHRRAHKYVPKPGTKGKRSKCVVCRLAASHLDHHGWPPSLNDGGSGMDHFAYQNLKHQWQDLWVAKLKPLGLPEVAQIVVEGRITFPDRIARDQGNFRYFIEKTLGDALQECGVLADDCFYPVRRFEFGQLDPRYVKGAAGLELILLPGLSEPPNVAP